MRNRVPSNVSLLVVVLVLLALGLPLVYSASSVRAEKEFHDSAYFLKRHVARVILGLFALVMATRVDYRTWLRFAPLIAFIAFVLSLLVFVPGLGISIRGSHRWIRLAGFQLQPSDVSRYALVIFVAAYLARNRAALSSFKRGVAPLLGVVALLVLPILFEPDAGTTGLLLLLCGLLLFLGGVKLMHLGALGAAGAGLLYAYLRTVPYQRVRLENFVAGIKGEIEPVWQVKQSLIGIGSGGVLGVGLGGSHQKYSFLPDPFTDFILSILGEELGLLGMLFVLSLFGWFILRGMQIALRAPDQGGMLLASGITLAIGLYALVNAAVVMNLFPTTGIPMPFLSYGGSAQMMNLFAVGILLRISKQTRAWGEIDWSLRSRHGRGSLKK